MGFKMIVLTVQAVEGTGMIEYSQIFVAMLGPLGNSILGISTACTAWADKITNTVCRKRVKVVIQVPFMRPSANDFAVLSSPKAAKTRFSFRDLALVGAEAATDAVGCSGRVFRKTKRPSAVQMDLFDLRPDILEVSADAGRAKPDGI